MIIPRNKVWNCINIVIKHTSSQQLSLNSGYYPGPVGFKFVVALNAFTTVHCTEAGRA